MCDAIVEVCRLRDWRAEELAILLQRHSRYVRNNYLRPLMRDGRLAMTNPNEPSDPQQAYRAVAAHLYAPAKPSASLSIAAGMYLVLCQIGLYPSWNMRKQLSYL